MPHHEIGYSRPNLFRVEAHTLGASKLKPVLGVGVRIAKRLRKVDKEVERLHVIANNNRSNYAPKLAEALRKEIGLREELQHRLAERTKQLKLL